MRLGRFQFFNRLEICFYFTTILLYYFISDFHIFWLRANSASLSALDYCSNILQFQVTGRLLKPPAIVFRDAMAAPGMHSTVHAAVNDGKWKFENPLYRPADIPVWALYGMFKQGEQGADINLVV